MVSLVLWDIEFVSASMSDPWIIPTTTIITPIMREADHTRNEVWYILARFFLSIINLCASSDIDRKTAHVMFSIVSYLSLNLRRGLSNLSIRRACRTKGNVPNRKAPSPISSKMLTFQKDRSLMTKYPTRACLLYTSPSPRD